MMRQIIPSVIASFILIACAGESDELSNGAGRGGRNNNGTDGTGDGTTPGSDPTQPGSCKEGVPHVGFAGTDFVQDRKVGGIGSDRSRIKPFSALKTDFQRTLGNIPAQMNASAPAYGDVVDRWYAEPIAGAVSLNTTYNLAFAGCFDTMTAANYSVMPTAATATEECAKMQRKFWSRTPTPDETQACANFAMGVTDPDNLAANVTADQKIRRHWAHACASVMTSTGFTTY